MIRPIRLLPLCLSIAAPLFAAPAMAQEVYAKAGFLGIGGGYAHSINEQFGLRADLTTIGSIKRDRTSGGLNYAAKLHANQLGAYGDWFPFGNGFRLSAGLHARKLQIEGDGRASGAGTITVNNTTVAYGANDSLTARVKYPDVAPYLGIGWGHHASKGKGWGFIADIGVSFGKPKTTLTVNDALYQQLDAAAQLGGTTAAAELEAQRKKLADDVEKLKVFPHLYVGVSYRF